MQQVHVIDNMFWFPAFFLILDLGSRLTGHVFKWQALIIIHPEATRGAVEKPNSSPSKHATATSLPV